MAKDRSVMVCVKAQVALLSILFSLLPQASLEQTPQIKPRKKPQPPDLHCNADKVTIDRGDVVNISVDSTDMSLIFAFGSSEGTLIVTGNKAKLNTAGVAEGTKSITVVCSAVDSDGNIVQANATLQMQPPPTALVAKK